MLTDAILNFSIDLFVLILALIPAPDWPDFIVGEGSGTLAGAFDLMESYIDPMSGWVNLPVLFATVTWLYGWIAAQRLYTTARQAVKFARGAG